MPAFVPHLAYGQRYLKHRLDINAAAFSRGTLFPDIRRMARWDRSRTHYIGKVTLSQVDAEANAWRAGFLFHNWLDDTWNEYISQYGLDIYSPDDVLPFAVLKLMEDGRIRARLIVGSENAEDLVVVDDEAVAFGADPGLVRRWGELIRDDVKSAWMDESWELLMAEGLGLDAAEVTRIKRQLKKMSGEGIWEERLDDAWNVIGGKIEARHA